MYGEDREEESYGGRGHENKAKVYLSTIIEDIEAPDKEDAEEGRIMAQARIRPDELHRFEFVSVESDVVRKFCEREHCEKDFFEDDVDEVAP